MSDDVVQPEGSGEPGPDAIQESTQTVDPGDFQAKIMAGGEAAWDEFRKQQASASRANARLSQAELAVQIAEKLGGGNLKAGAETALTELMLFQQMRQNPALGKLIERFKSGERLDAVDSIGSGYEPIAEETDPRVQQLQALQSDVAALKSQLGLTRTVEQLRGFMESPLCATLTPAEKGELLGEIQSTMRTWGETPLGRDKLATFSADDAETIGLKYLHKSGLILKLGNRDAQQRSDDIRSRETDSPDRLQTSGASRSADRNESPADSARIVAQQLGIPLH